MSIKRILISGIILLFLQVTSAESLVDSSAQVQCVTNGFGFAEGAVADAKGNLYFTDIPNSRIYRWSVENKLSLFREHTGHANGLRFDNAGNLLACAGAARRVTSKHYYSDIVN